MDNNRILSEVTPQTQKKVDETEEAAFFINQAHKEFRNLAYGVARKKNSVARVLEAVLFEPLEEVKLQGKAEEQLFAFCQEIMQNKGKVLRYAFERAEKIKKGEPTDE